MDAQDSLKLAKRFIREQGGQIAPLTVSEEEINPESQDDLSLQAYALEPTVTCYPIDYRYPDDAKTSEFSFFEDGKQRTIHIGFLKAEYGTSYVLIPIHYFVVAAVILEREDHKLKLWNSPIIRQGILVEKSLVPNQFLLEKFEDAGLLVLDIEAGGGDYFKLRSKALQKAKDQRLEIEDELIKVWRTCDQSSNRFLVVDGTLMNFRDEQNIRQCVGVSKSFGSRYFTVSENNRIMQMRKFERSWTFSFHRPEDDIGKGARERISWYLRIRSKINSDPEFGMIRVEISRSYRDKSSEMAERFSKSLISERLPTSYPAPRWDNHLYPIGECENYLSSVMPSIEKISASMKGVTS